MISSKHRIPKGQFPAILKNPSLQGSYFRAVIAPSISGIHPHFAVIIAKKYAKLAVTRNVFRRALFDAISKRLNIFTPVSIIFIMQKPIVYEKTPTGRKYAARELANDADVLLDKVIKKYEKSS
jgi:ribonuclease P protein component